MSRGRAIGVVCVSALLLVTTCSTLAPTPQPEECSSDAECADGFVCAVDQGRCLPGNEAAPRAHLGFDVREGAGGGIVFRVEVDGCDCTIREEENIRELALRRSEVSQLLFLDVRGAVPDDPEAPVPATFELTQPSRYGQAPTPFRNLVVHPTEDDDTETIVDTVVRWPRYHPFDIAPPRELLLWKVEPADDLPLRYLGIKPPRTNDGATCTADSDCCPDDSPDCDPYPNFCNLDAGECTLIGSPEFKFGYVYEPACNRGLDGSVRDYDLEQGQVVLDENNNQQGLLDANVRVRYADSSRLGDSRTQPPRFGIPVLGNLAPADRPAECNSDAECDVHDEFCDTTTSQCLVALGGRSADEGQ
ncbi:MAG: hypothetical protein K0V04_17895, partial [Deltaproteobacteria bacterium]|nr:hypothetical protein [Deltaproteobacteria bacterium]